MYKVLEIVFTVLQLALVAICFRALRRVTKQTMYSYKVISLVGAIIFFSVCFFSHFISIITWPQQIDFEVYNLVGHIIGSFTSFASIVTFLILPPFCLSLLISNIVLLKKEGKSLPNLLGILLCSALIIGSAAVFFSYDILDQFMNVHSYLGYCFSLWFENLFSISVSYIECLLFATIFVSFKAGHHIPKLNKDYIIILGCRMRDDGKPAGLLRERIDRALEFAKMQKNTTQKEICFIPSGGQGPDEVLSEAKSMYAYLLEKHVPKSKITIEDKSTTTLENFRFSKKKIKTTERIAFATSNYHVFRAGVIASKVGFKSIEGIGSRSPWYYHDSALIREFIANLNSEKHMHLKNLAAITISLTVIIIVCYFSNCL